MGEVQLCGSDLSSASDAHSVQTVVVQTTSAEALCLCRQCSSTDDQSSHHIHAIAHQAAHSLVWFVCCHMAYQVSPIQPAM